MKNSIVFRTILFVFSIALLSSCGTNKGLPDSGEPGAWNDEGKPYIESIHVLVIPAIFDEPWIPALRQTLEDTLREHGLIADVEILDRLALETDSQRKDRLQELDMDVYARLSLNYFSSYSSTYDLDLFAGVSEPVTFYSLSFDHTQFVIDTEDQENATSEVISKIMKQLKTRNLISPTASENIYED